MSSPASYRRFVVLSLVFAVVGALAVPAAANGAFDDDGSVHESDINFIAALGITQGCNPPDNDEYCPDDPVTREQMASFLRRTFDLPAGPDAFGDDDGSVHEDDINAIAAAGITFGCNPPQNDEYCPTDPVTRAQMASFVVRAMGDVTSFNAPIFDDAFRGEVHTADINALAGLGITRGCNPPQNDEYCPHQAVTRAEMASFLARTVRLGDARPPDVEITSPEHLATIITQADPGAGTFAADVTFVASATDPDGDAVTGYRWDSSVDGTLGMGNPLDATLTIPAGQTSSQPFISVVATDETGLFSGHEIQLKLILPSP
ncbi:MAG: S-layer homology domain-containing protein [Actinomycetota bacterium]